jgi:hypothetical protein
MELAERWNRSFATVDQLIRVTIQLSTPGAGLDLADLIAQSAPDVDLGTSCCRAKASVLQPRIGRPGSDDTRSSVAAPSSRSLPVGNKRPPISTSGNTRARSPGLRAKPEEPLGHCSSGPPERQRALPEPRQEALKFTMVGVVRCRDIGDVDFGVRD